MLKAANDARENAKLIMNSFGLIKSHVNASHVNSEIALVSYNKVFAVTFSLRLY